MYIDSFITPIFSCSGVSIQSTTRKSNIVHCISDSPEIEQIVIEFEDEDCASLFEQDVQDEVGNIQIDEDNSLEAAPKKLQKAYWKAKKSGNEAKIEELLTILWEDYGIQPESDEPLETSGIRRIAVMTDHGVNAWGFKDMKRELRDWMRANGFPDANWNLTVE